MQMVLVPGSTNPKGGFLSAGRNDFVHVKNREEDSSHKLNAIAKCFPLVTHPALPLLLVAVLVSLVCLFGAGYSVLLQT